MADFDISFQKTMKNEGGFVLHTISGDHGGMTYAGIARNFWPNWDGWKMIDAGQVDDTRLSLKVQEFYRRHFWDAIRGDDIIEQDKADRLFDYAVNVGISPAVKAAQKAADVAADGIFGPVTLAAINNRDGKMFALRFFKEKIARYAAICNRNRDQSRFLLGWVNRSLREVF